MYQSAQMNPPQATAPPKASMVLPGAARMPPGWYTFHILFIWYELVIVMLYGFCFRFDPIQAMITPLMNRPIINDDVYAADGFFTLYPYFTDILVMAFVGFTFVLAYMKYNNQTNISTGFFAGALTIQVYIIYRAFFQAIWTSNWDIVELEFSFFLTSLYCVIAVMIAWSAVMGKVGPCQVMHFAIALPFLYALNEQICFITIGGYDLGGSSTVFAFGGAFGFAMAIGTYRRAAKEVAITDPRNHTRAGHASTFALLGTLLIWVFWPSLNAARITGYIPYGFGYGNQLERAVMNTVFALTGSVIGTFIISAFLHRDAFDVEHIMKGTLAGGVMIAQQSDLGHWGWDAILVGAFAGGLTTLLMGLFHPKTRSFDTFGVFYVFLLPGVLGGFWSAIYAANLPTYTQNGLNGTTTNFPYGRTANGQAGSQLAIMGISVGIAFLSGLATGIIIRFCRCFRPEDKDLFGQDTQIMYPPTELTLEPGFAPRAI